MKLANSHILTINGGSSSIKFALFDHNSLQCIIKGSILRIGLPDTTLQINNISESVVAKDYKAAVNMLIGWLEKSESSNSLTAIGHRVVHGGPKYIKPQRISSEMIADLQEMSVFDPEHMPEELLLIETFYQKFPEVPQIACFDTAFHHDLPRVAKILPIPRHYEKQGVYRYGFHGLSYEFLMEELNRIGKPKEAGGRVILAHLGNGASLAAILHGKPIDTSMSFTPTAGIPMGTRSGDLDPGLVLYLTKTEGLNAKSFNEMVNFQSGLLGISETSSNMQDLLKKEAHDVRAKEAIDLFCYQVKKWIGAFTAALGGLDTLVFSGGIGENASEVRTRICEGLECLGIAIQEKQNKANAQVISDEISKVTVRVIHTDEELMIAKTLCQILKR